MENTMIITTKADLKNIVKEAVTELQADQQRKTQGEKTFTINEIAKRLHIAHATCRRYVERGLIKSTKSGRITEAAIQEYLIKKQ